MAPGSRLYRFASRWFDERTVARVFEPLLADYQREWAEASAARRRLVTIRTVVAFIVSAMALAPRAILFTPTPAAITRRILARMILFCSVACGLLMLPFLTQLREIPPARLAWLLMWLAPSTLLLVFPFAMGFVIDGVRRHRQPTQPERIAVLRAAMIAVAVVAIANGWIVPAANQQFRTTVASDRWQTPARGMRELSTTELLTHPDLAKGPEDPYSRADALRRELHNRASLALVPAVLMWLRWRALNHPSPEWLLPPWLSGTVTIGAYFFLRENDARIESMLGLGPGAAAWVPLAVFLAVGIIRDRAAARRVTPIFHA